MNEKVRVAGLLHEEEFYNKAVMDYEKEASFRQLAERQVAAREACESRMVGDPGEAGLPELENVEEQICAAQSKYVYHRAILDFVELLRFYGVL